MQQRDGRCITGVPRPYDNAHPPRTHLGSLAQAYSRVLGGWVFSYERGSPVPCCEPFLVRRRRDAPHAPLPPLLGEAPQPGRAVLASTTPVRTGGNFKGCKDLKRFKDGAPTSRRKGGTFKSVQDFCLKAKFLTVLYVPHWLDPLSGQETRPGEAALASTTPVRTGNK